MEIDHEIISSAILLPSADSRRVVFSESMFTDYWLTAKSSLPRKKVWNCNYEHFSKFFISFLNHL